jgi:Family of unknown function (DUF5694)
MGLWSYGVAVLVLFSRTRGANGSSTGARYRQSSWLTSRMGEVTGVEASAYHCRHIQVDADLDFDAVDAYAKAHNQTYLVDANRHQTERLTRRATEIQSKGTVLDVYRYLNSEAAIRLNDASYTYICRIGDDSNFVGVDFVSAWHQRNLRTFAKLSRLTGPGERILVLYGQGHSYLLRDLIRQAGSRHEAGRRRGAAALTLIGITSYRPILADCGLSGPASDKCGVASPA